MIQDKIGFIENLNLEIVEISGDEVRCICPLHDDSDPSLHINVQTGKFQCWAGCLHGTSLKMLYEKLTGKEYVEDVQDDWLVNFKKKFLIRSDITKVPTIPILPSAIGTKGEEYLCGRKITTRSISEWHIQYWDSIDGIVIPLEEVGYVIRYLNAEKTRDKYKYASGTKITNTLFGFNKLNFDKYNFIILVEGVLDKIFLHQLGFTNSLAIMHADLSKVQKSMLLEHMKPVYLMLDPDEAGKMASKKIFNMLKHSVQTYICNLPEGKDPDQCTFNEVNESITTSRRRI